MMATNFRENQAPGGSRVLVSVGGDRHGGVKDIAAVNETSVEIVSRYKLSAGDLHMLHADVAHQVVAIGEHLSATLVITAPPCRSTSRIYRPLTSSPSSKSVPVAFFDFERVVELINKAIDCCLQSS
jgi:hypothetical protein